MIVQDITVTGGSEIKIDKIPMVDYLEFKAQSLSRLKECIYVYSDKEWLNKATIEAFNSLDNETHELIKQTNIELIRAKKLLKEKYPIRYRLSALKVIIKNPIKSIIGCLLMLR